MDGCLSPEHWHKAHGIPDNYLFHEKLSNAFASCIDGRVLFLGILVCSSPQVCFVVDHSLMVSHRHLQFNLCCLLAGYTPARLLT